MRSKRAWMRVAGAALATVLLWVGAAEAQAPALSRTDLRYRTVKGEGLLLDVYYSPLPGERPVLMLIHGGSWRQRDKKDWQDLAPVFVDAGYTVVVPNYRLATRRGGVLFPSPVNDLRHALAWTRANVSDYWGDPNRVGMLGTSAGGHLALMSAVAGKDRPKAVGAYSPPVDLRRLHRRGILWWSIENFLGCAPSECRHLYRRASPVYRVDRKTPPVFMAYSRGDSIPAFQGRVMRRKLTEVGIGSTLHLEEGRAHGLPLAQKALEETIGFFNQNL